MPGTAHTRLGYPIEKRSRFNLIWMLFIGPSLEGLAILTFSVVQIVKRGHEFTASGWFWQVGWFGLLGLLLMTAGPATGYREFHRRRRVDAFRQSDSP